MSLLHSELYSEPLDWDAIGDGRASPHLENSFLINIRFSMGSSKNAWSLLKIINDYEEATSKSICFLLQKVFKILSSPVGANFVLVHNIGSQLQTIKRRILKELRISVNVVEYNEYSELQAQIDYEDPHFKVTKSAITSSLLDEHWLPLLQKEFGGSLFGRFVNGSENNSMECVLLEDLRRRGIV